MPYRYRFDLESQSEVIRDDIGVEADCPDQAIEEAMAEIEEMLAIGDFPASLKDWKLVIRDEDDNELKRIPL